MKLITCEFNMDSGCVELRFDDGTMLDIDCTAKQIWAYHTAAERTGLAGIQCPAGVCTVGSEQQHLSILTEVLYAWIG